MTNTTEFDRNVATYEGWYDKYPEVFKSELLAIREMLAELPENLRGLEVGVGTGRFAQALGIREGVEPSGPMAQKALKRGVEIMDATAERLPYADLQFDFVLFVTICHLRDVQLALEEAFRVLKKEGAVIVGFLDRERPIAREYWARRKRSTFFRNARFYDSDHIQALLRATGFSILKVNQTLFGALDEVKEAQLPRPGSGEGSFVTILASKP